jgi:hypothetical protein
VVAVSLQPFQYGMLIRMDPDIPFKRKITLLAAVTRVV